MTKKVRIENADTSDYKVVVEIWNKVAQSQVEGEVLPDTKVSTTLLASPASLGEFYIHDGCYLVVKELR